MVIRMGMYGLPGSRFRLGVLFVTPEARKKLSPIDVLNAVSRHVRGDWGDLCEADWRENDQSLREGFGVLSS